MTTVQSNPLFPFSSNAELNQAYHEGKTTKIPIKATKPPDMTEMIRVGNQIIYVAR